MNRLRPPTKIGSIRLLEPLGEGGMALVFRGVDCFRPETSCAVKLLRPEVHGDRDLVRRFLREGEVLTRLSHPNLVEIQAFGQSGEWPYLVMELLPGGSLKACRGEAPAALVRRLVPICEALGVAHRAGVVHRDLKPSNLLFSAEGHLKVTDFGVCFWEGEEGRTRATRSQMVVGTLGYMAPEQHGDPRRVDGRCDVYALGAILYEFTTGQPYAQVQLAPSAVRTGFPPRLAGLVMRGLQPDPGKRIQSMEALGQELLVWLDTAEAAGWGGEPLPGFAPGEREAATLVGSRRVEGPEVRLAPYLDALFTGHVGSRREAAEGLVAAVKVGDGPWLAEALTRAPEGARFALVRALGRVGGAEVLPQLLGFLADPFAQREAAEAAAELALRAGAREQVLEALRESGLGSAWRWSARATLGDESWVAALVEAWATLAPPFRIQVLEAARHLPEALRARAKVATAQVSGLALTAWEKL